MAAARTQGRTQATWFVSGLPEEADEDSLMRHIERIDRTIKTRLITLLRNHQTMRSRCVAIVEFDTVEDGTAEV